MEHFSRAGLVFDVSDEGPDDGESVLLLHGWPQDHTAWRHVAPLLHAAGLRTLAPDQRGYSPGARPRGRAAYGMGELVADAVALLDAAGVARAHVVGHDWGGSVAWALAERHPERVSSLTVLSTPHHHAMGWAMRHGDQLRRSWYMFAFQLPLLPEAVLRRRLPAGAAPIRAARGRRAPVCRAVPPAWSRDILPGLVPRDADRRGAAAPAAGMAKAGAGATDEPAATDHRPHDLHLGPPRPGTGARRRAADRAVGGQ